MSQMEFYYGAFQESQVKAEPEDTDEYYDWEKSQGKEFVKVQGKVYEFWKIEELDTDGFMFRLPPANDLPYTRFIAYWYNGGAGHREVVEAVIEGSFK
jgi:hypothetical protein